MAGNIIQDILLRIKGDSSGAEKALGTLSTKTKQTETEMTSASKGMNLGFAAVGAGMVAAGVAIDRSMKNAREATVKYGSSVLTVQRLTGANAEQASLMAAMFQRYGVEGSKVALIMKSLSAAIAGQSEDLKALGVATQNSDGTNRTHLEVLGDLAEAYKNAEDKSQVLTVGAKTLGRGFSALLPILAGGRQAIEQYAASVKRNGLGFDQAAIDRVREYSKALKDNKDAVLGLEMQVGMATLPFETWKTKAIGESLARLQQLNPEIANTAGALGSLAGPLLKATGSLMTFAAMAKYLGVGGMLGGLGGSLATVAAAAGPVALLGGAVVGLVMAAGKLAGEYQKWRVEQELAVIAARHARMSVEELAAEQGRASLALQKTATRVDVLNGNLHQNVTATRSAVEQTKGVYHSQARFGDALKNTYGALGMAEDASDSYSDALDYQSEMTDEATGEQITYARALDGSMQSASGVAAAMRTVEEAQMAQIEAGIAQREADRKVIELRKNSKTTADEMTAALLEQERAHLKNKDATFDWGASLTKARETMNLAVFDTNVLTKEQSKLGTELFNETRKVHDLTASLDGIPKEKKPKVLADIAKGKARIAEIKSDINKLPKEKTFTVKGNVIQAHTALARILAQMDAIKQKLGFDVYINATLREGRATGGPVKAGVAYLVGEEGPEMFVAPADGRVLNAQQTAAVKTTEAPPMGQLIQFRQANAQGQTAAAASRTALGNRNVTGDVNEAEAAARRAGQAAKLYYSDAQIAQRDAQRTLSAAQSAERQAHTAAQKAARHARQEQSEYLREAREHGKYSKEARAAWRELRKDRAAANAAAARERQAEDDVTSARNNLTRATLDLSDAQKLLQTASGTARDEVLSEAADRLEEQLQEAVDRIKEKQAELDARKQSILGAFDLFANPSAGRKPVAARDLLESVTIQRNRLRQWMADIQSLKQRGVGGELLQELLQRGPAAAEEVHALVTMTGQQLQQYRALYNERNALAGTQAGRELGTNASGVSMTVQAGAVQTTINVAGNANEEQIRRAVEDALNELVRRSGSVARSVA